MNKRFSYLTIMLIILLVNSANAGVISIPDYGVNDTLTSTNLNSWQNTVENTLNGGLDNNNVNTAGGYRLLEVLGVLPAATQQGRVIFHTPDNMLYFDSGLALYPSASYSGTFAQGDMLYFDGTTNWDLLNKNTTATKYLSNRGTSNNPSWNYVNLDNGVENTLGLANGGTDREFKDPNANRLWYWNDTGGVMDWLTPASGITVANGSIYNPWILLFTYTLGGGACTANANGIIVNDSITAAANTETTCAYWGVYADAAKKVIETRFKKVAGIDTATFYANIWNSSNSAGDGARVKVEFGTGETEVVSTIVAGTDGRQTPEWVTGTVNISGLTNNTVYKVTIYLYNADPAQSSYMDSIIAWGSDDN